MERNTITAAIAGSSDEDLPDTLLQLAVTAWLQQDATIDDIQLLVEEIAGEV